MTAKPTHAEIAAKNQRAKTIRTLGYGPWERWENEKHQRASKTSSTTSRRTSDRHRRLVHQLDLANPDRPCGWCRNPRNSDQCGFGTSEIHYYQEKYT